MADQSARPPQDRSTAAAAITELLEQIDAGDITGTATQRAYLSGARDAISAMNDPAPDPDTAP